MTSKDLDEQHTCGFIALGKPNSEMSYHGFPDDPQKHIQLPTSEHLDTCFSPGTEQLLFDNVIKVAGDAHDPCPSQFSHWPAPELGTLTLAILLSWIKAFRPQLKCKCHLIGMTPTAAISPNTSSH